MECLKCKREMETIDVRCLGRYESWTIEQFNCPHCGALHQEEKKVNDDEYLDLVE